MIANSARTGAFTSSMIYVLMAKGNGVHGFSDKALTYIHERQIERRLGRSTSLDNPTRDMLWGLFLEQRVYNLLGGEEFSEYKKVSNETIIHHRFTFWAGSPDLISHDKNGDIKCFKPKNFALLADTLSQKDISLFRESHPKEYWQLVSNSTILNVPKAESIAYMPYESELDAIKEMADYLEGEDQWKYKFISDAVSYNRNSLSFLPDGGYYKNLNRFEFVVPTEDMEALEKRILLAESLINNSPSVLMAKHDKEFKATIIEQSNPLLNFLKQSSNA